jgi:peptidoglycan/LPS O-acetylase OafA/YrhL
MRKSGTFTALNGLRFLAALAVVIFHYAPRVDGYARLPVFPKNVMNEGPAAVGFFFILSGFVLAHRYLHGGSDMESARDFYRARFLRLYPAYLLAFLLYLPVAVQRYVLSPLAGAGGRHTFFLSAILSGLMLQSWTPLAQAWNGPSWSLSVEAFMYLMFPLIGFRLARISRRSSALTMLFVWMFPASLAVTYEAHRISDTTWKLYVTNDPLVWLPLFVMGVCASRMIPAWEKVSDRAANRASGFAFAALIVVTLLWPARWADVFVTGGIAPVLAAVILFFTRVSGRITRFVGGAFLSRLGEASYAVYILQAPLWHYWQETTNSLRGVPEQTSIVALWQFVEFVPVLVIASLMVHRYVEIPVRGWLAGWKNQTLRAPAVNSAEVLVG